MGSPLAPVLAIIFMGFTDLSGYKFSSNQNKLKTNLTFNIYFNLPYIGNLSHHINNKLLKLCKEFCKENFNNELVFNSFKIKNCFSYKDPIPNDLKSFLVYRFTCASCISSYIGETCHFMRIEEHIKKDNKSHIFKHLHSTATCLDSYNSLCFNIKANTKSDLKIKETLHINLKKPNLNVQQNHLALTHSICPPLFFSLLLFLFFFYLLVSLSLTLIISIFYCLNYTLLFLHPSKAHLVPHISLSFIVFIISMLIIGPFTVLITLCYYFISL